MKIRNHGSQPLCAQSVSRRVNKLPCRMDVLCDELRIVQQLKPNAVPTAMRHQSDVSGVWRIFERQKERGNPGR